MLQVRVAQTEQVAPAAPCLSPRLSMLRGLARAADLEVPAEIHYGEDAPLSAVSGDPESTWCRCTCLISAVHVLCEHGWCSPCDMWVITQQEHAWSSGCRVDSGSHASPPLLQLVSTSPSCNFALPSQGWSSMDHPRAGSFGGLHHGGVWSIPLVVRDRVTQAHASPAQAAATPLLDTAGGGVVLVTGGVGGLGQLIAQFVARGSHGAAVPCLLSRKLASGAPTGRATRTDAANPDAARVWQCDAATAADMDAVQGALTTQRQRIRLIVHAAGVLRDSPLGSLTPGTLRLVSAPKASAARRVEHMVGGSAAGACAVVYFSSLAGALGSAGQTAYAAANAFLDAAASAVRCKVGVVCALQMLGLWWEGW